jgi:hypothetical protein
MSSSEWFVPTSLPPVHQLPDKFISTHISTYRLVLNAEANARSQTDRMHARIVGYLMIQLCDTSLASKPLAQIATEVASANKQDEHVDKRIYALGLFYRENLLRSCEY